MREKPELFSRKENCCGCSACYAICPQNAITMEADEKGFLYPVIDSEKCIGCRMCLKVCVFKEEQSKRGYL
nr:4Fe-4S dicluster domain-containing protein [uncultured Blautia sp.]